MKKFLSTLCLVGLVALPLAACAPKEEPAEETTPMAAPEEAPMAPEMETDTGMMGGDEMMGSDMDTGMDEMGDEGGSE